MATCAQRRRSLELLVAAGDVWAWVIDRFHERARLGLPAANSVVDVWPDLRARGPFGDLSMHVAQDVAKEWSSAFFEVMRRRKRGESVQLPLRKRRLRPVRFRRGEFVLHAAPTVGGGGLSYVPVVAVPTCA